MIPKMKRLTFAVAQTLGAGVALAVIAVPAVAQQQSAQTKERIEVTGSNIKRVEGESALVDIPNAGDIVGKMPAAPEGYEIARVDVVVRLRRKES